MKICQYNANQAGVVVGLSCLPDRRSLGEGRLRTERLRLVEFLLVDRGSSAMKKGLTVSFVFGIAFRWWQVS